MAIEDDPTLSPSQAAPSPVAPASDQSRAWIGNMRQGIKARLFANPNDADAAEDPVPTSYASNRIGRYVVIERIGAGGMGIVYAAYDDKLDRKVAVKLLRPGYGPVSETARQRLLREAQAIARLSHRSVVQVYEVGTHDDEVFIAMEYVEGRTLKQWQPSRDWRDILARYLDAGRGLCAAHAAGIVHRDFKADNVLVRASDLAVRVVDFGLARTERQDVLALTDADAVPEDADPSLTRTGLIMGTPAYMAPEQHLAHATDARTDQFSFCASLFEALYGYRAFAGERLDELRANVLAGKIEPAPRYTSVPPNIHKVLARGLAVDPARRFPTMESLLGALELPRPAKPWRRVAWALGLTVAAVGGSVAWSTADAGGLSSEGIRVRAALDTALQAEPDAELDRLRRRTIPQRWNDLVLAYATSVSDPAIQLAALKHLSMDDTTWLPAARTLASDAIRRGPVFATALAPSTVASVRFSPDTDHVLARTADGKVLVWSTPGALEAKTLTSGAIDAAFLERGRVAVLLPQGVLTTLQLDGSETTTRTLHGGELTRVATDTHDRISVGAEDGSVYVVEDDAVEVLRQHTAPISALCFHPTLDTLATGDRGGNVTLWYLERDTHRSMSAEQGIESLAWLDNGQLLASTAEGLAAWDGEHATPVAPRLGKGTTGFAVAADGRTRLERSGDGIRVVLADGTGLDLHRDRDVLSVSRRGRWSAAAKGDRVEFWRTGTDASGTGPRGERHFRLAIQDTIVGVHVHEDRIIVATSDGEILRQTRDGFETIASLRLRARGMQAGPEGRRVAVESAPDGAIHVIDLDAPGRPSVLRQIDGAQAGPMVWAREGTAIAKLHCPNTRTSCDLSVHRTDGSAPWGVGKLLSQTLAVYISPSGDRVALRHEGGLRLWDLPSGERRAFAPPPHMQLLAAGFGPSGALRLASHAPRDETVALHVGQLDDDGDMRTLLEQDGLRRLVPTASGDGLVMQTASGRALLWRLSTDTFTPLPPDALEGLDMPEVHVSPAGTRLWVAEVGAPTVTAFDLETGQRQRLPRPVGHLAWPESGGWVDLVSPTVLRQWGASAPRDAEAFARWLPSRTRVEIPVSSLRRPVSAADKAL